MARRFGMDFSGEEEFGDFPPWLSDLNGPAGIYGGIITKVDDGMDKANNYPLMKIWWKILFGPIGHDRMNQFNGSAITQQLSFHPNAKGAIMHFLHMIGEPYQGQVQIDLDRWMNRRARLKVVIAIPDGYDREFWSVDRNSEWLPADNAMAGQLPSAAKEPKPSSKPIPQDEHGPTEPAPPDDGWEAPDIPF